MEEWRSLTLKKMTISVPSEKRAIPIFLSSRELLSKSAKFVRGNVSRTLAAFAGMVFWTVGASPLLAQMVTVNPVEASGPLTNPLMGFRPGLGNYSQYPYPTLIHVYIPWKTIENQESDSVQKIRDYCNAQWANLPSNNVKVIPRVYIDWDSNTGNEAWPSDLTTGDWSSQQFKDRVVRLVGRLGEVWNDDPRVAWVQTGIIGHWGEQESPVGIGQDGWGQRLGDAFTAAFPNKKFIVRNMGSWPAYDVGVYWDSFGHPGQRPWAWTDIINFNKQGRYLTEVVEGEVAYNWGIGGEFKDLYGGVWDPNANSGNGDWASSPDITLGNAQYTDNMIDVIRELHGSALGWIASYNPNDAIVRAQAARMQKEFGYRFHVNEFSCSARADPGANLDFQFKVENKGSAPFYENWPLAVVLVDKNTRQLLWKATIPNVDIRKWHPGADYSKTTRTYQTPAQEHLISASIPLPANLPVGEHLIGLTILEPLSRTPGLFFAIPNFFKQSQTQPLCKIGIGMNATGHILDGIVFDDLVGDDARSYTMTPQGPSYSLNLQTSSQGFISQTPGGGSHRKDSGLEVTAKGNLGYAFSSWGGALAGRTENPTIIVMDADKTISANYVSVPTYTLTTNATNGSVTLDPPGGVYNSGTVVTVTASPDNGFTFSHWSGDLAGSTSIATLIMEGDKGVSANFADFAGDRVPWMETFTLPNGTQADGPPSAWTATRSTGMFEVSNNRFMINGGSTEGVFETAEISIAGGSFRVSLEVQGEGGLDSGDYVRFYKIVDDGPPVLIGPQIVGAVTGTQTLVGTNLTGSKLKLRIATKVTFSNEYYYFDNLAVEQEAPPTYTLATSATYGMIALNPPGGVYAAGSVVIVTATPNSGNNFDSWFGDFTGNTNPITVTMNGNKSVMANFSRSTLATIDSTGTTTVLDFDYPQNTYIGNGTLQVSTDGSVESEIHLGGGPNNAPTVFAMTGGLITIDNGASLVNGGWAKGIWTDNKADMLVNGTLDLWDGQAVRVNALNGAGSVEFGYPWGGGPRELDVGVEGGSGKFSGSIAGTSSLWKYVHPYSKEWSWHSNLR